MLICPECQSALRATLNQPIFCHCGRSYSRLPSGGVDFLQGKEFPDFHLDPNDAAQHDLLEQEAAGIAWRIEGFILPLIRRFSSAAGTSKRKLTVLDCGCGNGISIDILTAHGMDAIGIDTGWARHQQWRARSYGACLHSANALRLPLANSSSDVILSSGLIEHIGIHEEDSSGYRARRLPDCHDQRQQFVHELVRVLKNDGFILLDHPNGASPADFWHGREAGGIRWHAPRGDMLPCFGELRRYFQKADPSLKLFSLSPLHRLRFRQVGKHWYGATLAPLMKIWLGIIDIPSFSFLARSFLNPYLVTLASRQQNSYRWIRP